MHQFKKQRQPHSYLIQSRHYTQKQKKQDKTDNIINILCTFVEYFVSLIQNIEKLHKRVDMKPTGSNLKKELQKNNFNIVEILYAILAKWYWFVIALVFTVGYSLYNISRIEPTYTRHTEILIKGTQKGTSIEEQMEAFAADFVSRVKGCGMSLEEAMELLRTAWKEIE